MASGGTGGVPGQWARQERGCGCHRPLAVPARLSPCRSCTPRLRGAGNVRAPGGASGGSSGEKGTVNGEWHPHPGEQRGVPHANAAHASPAARVRSGAGVQLHSPVWGPSRSLCWGCTVWGGRHGVGRALRAVTDPEPPAASLEGVRVGPGPGQGARSVGGGTGSPGSPRVSQQLVSVSNTWHLSLLTNVI